MPLYEYKCAKCDAVFEVIQKFSDAPLAEHSNCGGAVERLVSKAALQFKGSGWYITDYAKGKSAAPAANGKSASAQSGDSKPAPAKTETKTSSDSAAPTKS